MLRIFNYRVKPCKYMVNFTQKLKTSIAAFVVVSLVAIQALISPLNQLVAVDGLPISSPVSIPVSTPVSTPVPVPTCGLLSISGLQAALGGVIGDSKYNACYDANNDGRIDIVDFSILLPILAPTPTPTPSLPIKADLVVNSIIINNAVVGSRSELVVTIKNIGNKDLTPININRLRINTVDVLVTIVDSKSKKSNKFILKLPQMKAGASSTSRSKISASFNKSGKYQVSAQVDPLNYYQEQNETNNSKTIQLLVSPKVVR